MSLNKYIVKMNIKSFLCPLLRSPSVDSNTQLYCQLTAISLTLKSSPLCKWGQSLLKYIPRFYRRLFLPFFFIPFHTCLCVLQEHSMCVRLHLVDRKKHRVVVNDIGHYFAVEKMDRMEERGSQCFGTGWTPRGQQEDTLKMLIWQKIYWKNKYTLPCWYLNLQGEKGGSVISTIVTRTHTPKTVDIGHGLLSTFDPIIYDGDI